MVRYLFWIVTGSILGAYISQNYMVPDVKKMIDQGITVAKAIEESFRKDKNEVQNENQNEIKNEVQNEIKNEIKNEVLNKNQDENKNSNKNKSNSWFNY
tara:strand:+ start:753 stop:1049 length:297 start_codon:yes stop_codon:yes gene_type:complete